VLAIAGTIKSTTIFVCLQASCDNAKLILVWKIDSDQGSLKLVKRFKGHRGAVTGLAFRQRSHTLYSCSADRAVKIWDLDEMAYVETHFGENPHVPDVEIRVHNHAYKAWVR
jgi:ribosomal RNA-processing protein 9